MTKTSQTKSHMEIEGEIINVKITTNGEDVEVITGGEIVYLSIIYLLTKILTT